MSMATNAHVEFVSFVLDVFQNSWTNVAALIGDNCATNKSFSRQAGCRFIGCASHRFNLAVKDILSQNEDIVMLIRALIVRLRNLIPSAKLRKLTPLEAKIDNETRWSSSF